MSATTTTIYHGQRICARPNCNKPAVVLCRHQRPMKGWIRYITPPKARSLPHCNAHALFDFTVMPSDIYAENVELVDSMQHGGDRGDVVILRIHPRT